MFMRKKKRKEKQTTKNDEDKVHEGPINSDEKLEQETSELVEQ